MSKHAQLLRKADREHEILSWARVHSNGRQKHDYPDRIEMAREESVKLVERLFLLPGLTKAPRMVIFAPVDVAHESGRICARAGATLAACVSDSVCLVDANLSSPSLHRYFGIENEGYGLQEMLVQSGEIRQFARQLPGQNLWLVTCRRECVDSHTLWSSDSMRLRLAEMHAAFDYVLIQAPPVSLDGTATLLGSFADGIVLVIEANSTRRAVALKVKEDLAFGKLPLLGAVLNNRTFPIPKVFYQHL